MKEITKHLQNLWNLTRSIIGERNQLTWTEIGDGHHGIKYQYLNFEFQEVMRMAQLLTMQPFIC